MVWPRRWSWWSFLSGVAAAIACMVAVASASVYMGAWRIDNAGSPSLLERRLATAALNAWLARRAPHGTSPLAHGDENALRGMRLYRGNCAGCHGAIDEPNAKFGLAFFPPAPQFLRYPPKRPDYELYYIVRNGIRRTGMTAWSSVLSDDDIWRVVGFLTQMDSLPASIDTVWRRPSHRVGG